MPEPDAVRAVDQLVVRHHRTTLRGRTIRYTTTTGTLVLTRETTAPGDAATYEGARPQATFFFVAYTREDAPDPAKRPVTFSFNGGPGSSSVWLHLGLLAPKRVFLHDDGMPPPPPYRLIDNPASLLADSDLVFIDPVGTGYSRAVEGGKPRAFHGFDGDVESVGDFIRLWTTRYGRWGSPKYLIGESYGTTRAAAVANYLMDRHALYLNGLMLVSTVLDFSTIRFEIGNDLPPLLFAPTYAAAAHHHRALAPDLLGRDVADVVAEVEAWALDRYGPALLRGDALPDADADAIALDLARYIGVSVDWVRRAKLRPDIQQFTKELLRDRGVTIGRLDARYTGVDRDGVADEPEYDPSYAAVAGAYGAVVNDYLRRELGFESDLPYELIAGLYHHWDYGRFQNRFVNVAETLRAAIARHPFLRVFVASGLYDLATPPFATRYTFDHLGLPAHLRGNVALRAYPAGHMMYVARDVLTRLGDDLARFVQEGGA